MSEFNIRSESIDVEQLMEQIRTRIREKRGVDYTEQQVQQLAAVKLEQFLDPKHVRSDLLDHYRRRMADLPDPEGDVPASPPLFEFDRDTIYRSSRGVVGRVLFGVRRLLRPVLKLFFNPTPVVHALHTQQQINAQVTAQVNWMMERSEQIAAKLKTRAELDALTYELLNNLVVEMTRLSIDVKNHKMQVESIAGRLDFDERRARALESVVEYRTQVAPARDGDSGGDGERDGGFGEAQATSPAWAAPLQRQDGGPTGVGGWRRRRGGRDRGARRRAYGRRRFRSGAVGIRGRGVRAAGGSGRGRRGRRRHGGEPARGERGAER